MFNEVKAPQEPINDGLLGTVNEKTWGRGCVVLVVSSEGVIRLGLRPRRITPSSISIILHKILSLIH